MSRESLGLFDTPPSRHDVRAGIVVVSLLFVACLLILPVRDTRLAEVTAFIPVVNSVMFVGELIIAAMLYAQATVFRSRALVVLASGYAFVAMLLVPLALTFPGAFADEGLLGAGINTAGWLATLRRIAFPVCVALYVLMFRAPDRPGSGSPATILGGLAAAVGLAAAATMLATLGHDWLPPLFVDRASVVRSMLIATSVTTIVLTLGAMLLLFLRRRSVLDLWLLVALSAWLIQSLLNLPLLARFTLGWYALYLMMLVSHLVVLVALIAESIRLYARLALTTAARSREREARRMSMDAVAAAIAHEVGQPLAAVTLNASAGINSLTGPKPAVAKAIEALRAINESARRSFDVLKSIRAMFAKEPGWATEFSIDELVRETCALMGTELAGAKAALDLSLDESVPPVLGNQVQVQHVLINLIANAIESVGSTRGRRRRITVRTAQSENGRVLLEVTDNGVGIAAEDTWRVFEAFNTIKPGGTGVGLSLCRTIVEEHGGRIWAEPGEKHGAVFHVQLPASRAATQGRAMRPQAARLKKVVPLR